jgi:hypothetical protein
MSGYRTSFASPEEGEERVHDLSDRGGILPVHAKNVDIRRAQDRCTLVIKTSLSQIPRI